MGKKGKNWEGSFILPLLTSRTGYSTAMDRAAQQGYHFSGMNIDKYLKIVMTLNKNIFSQQLHKRAILYVWKFEFIKLSTKHVL